MYACMCVYISATAAPNLLASDRCSRGAWSAYVCVYVCVYISISATAAPNLLATGRCSRGAWSAYVCMYVCIYQRDGCAESAGYWSVLARRLEHLCMYVCMYVGMYVGM
jgi:hypothetical protein